MIPDNLEVKTLVHEPLTTVCDCGCQMKRIGEDKQDKLGIIPKQFYIERHIYPKWVCRECDIIHQAATPSRLLTKASPPQSCLHTSLLANMQTISPYIGRILSISEVG
nr:IS66 family transposase zinc-finger binding domain-containing protein [Psychrobacter sp. PraFG1]UNK05576.1 IS66 family transposase zinc-finger binding domain-containing protein [Psychrobacter sp. PraFG1]